MFVSRGYQLPRSTDVLDRGHDMEICLVFDPQTHSLCVVGQSIVYDSLGQMYWLLHLIEYWLSGGLAGVPRFGTFSLSHRISGVPVECSNVRCLFPPLSPQSWVHLVCLALSLPGSPPNTNTTRHQLLTAFH
jgi:hypothetical protein